VSTGTSYAFDLDGTITQQEILPLIATELGLKDEIGLLTKLTIEGIIPFEDSFRLRCAVLRSVPVSTVQSIVATVPLEPSIERFIKERRDRCSIVTGNLLCWVQPIVDRLGCNVFASEANVQDDRIVEVASVLNKGRALATLRGHDRMVAIGDSHNDIPMFEVADIGVAFGGIHVPIPALVNVSDYVVFDGKALCRLLSTL
jgi:phosphoserine phosphatase